MLCGAKDLFCNANEKNNPVFTWQRCWESVLGNAWWPGSQAVSRGWGNWDIHIVTCSHTSEGHKKGAWLSLGRPIWSCVLSVLECSTWYNSGQSRCQRLRMTRRGVKGFGESWEY